MNNYDKKVEDDGEMWKPVMGYETKYEVSNIGRFKILNYKNSGQENISTGSKSKDGYHRVYIRKEGHSWAFLLHRLVGTHFLEKSDLPDQNQINHKDGNKSNNHISNLEWVNAYENTAHAKRTGLFDNSGENNYWSKLTIEEVSVIIKMISTGRISQRKISYIFDVSPMTISNIVNGKSWKIERNGDNDEDLH